MLDAYLGAQEPVHRSEYATGSIVYTLEIFLI